MSTSSDARSDFDPYHQWLGIAPAQRPYDHYCLLGLRTFEDDRQVISNAAQRRMAELRKRRTGDTARDAQQLIAELSKATTCLLNANRKRLYDRHLRDTLGTQSGEPRPRPPVSASKPAPSASAPAADSVAEKKSSSKHSESIRPAIVASAEKHVRRKTNPVLLGGGIAVASLVIIAAGMMFATSGDTGDVDQGSRVAQSPGDSPPGDSSPGDSPEASAPDLPAPATNAFLEPAQSTDPPATVTSPSLESGGFELPFDTTPPASTAPAVPAEIPLPPEVPLPFAPTDEKPKSIRLAGTDRIALTEPLTSLNFGKPFTLEMWVRFEKGTYAHWLMGDLVFGNAHPEIPAGVTAGWQAWIMQTEGGKQRFAISTGKGFWAEYPASEGAWRHLAVSGDGTTVAIYVDGRRAASQPAAILADHHVPSPLPLHFGSHHHMHPTQPPGMQGEFRAVRISTDCRYRENFTPKVALDHDDATELAFDFQHANSSRRIDDLSRHNRHGTLWGAQWLAISEAELAPATSPVATTPPGSGTGSPTATPTAPGSPAAVTPTRLPAPAEADLQAAKKRIETLFETEIAAARRPAEQLALAAKLVSLSGESTDDRTTQFVLFEMATDRLARGNDLSKALKVIDDFAAEFEIDRLARRAAVIRSTGSGPLTLIQRQELAETALRAGEEMKRAGRFELVATVAQTAVSAATRARSQDLGRRARYLRDEAKRSSHLAQEAEAAQQQLATAPEDPAANLVCGKFLCLQLNQWNAGAAHLAKSNIESLKQAAAAELKISEGAEAQAAAADLWYTARTAIDKNDLGPLLEHVLELSREAAPRLKGISKLTLEKRMEEIAAELPTNPGSSPAAKSALPRFEPPLELQALLGRLQVDGRDVSILWKYRSGLRLADSNVTEVLTQTGIARGRLQLDFVGKLNLPETTTVNVMHQGGSMDATAKLHIDGKLIGILGGENATSDVHKVDLAKGEHTVAWQLVGRELGTNSLRFMDAAEATPLVVYHDAMLLNAVRETPNRARLTVNLLGGAGN